MEWTMTASSTKATVNLVWKPAPEPPSQAQKKKLSPATRRRNAERASRRREQKAVVKSVQSTTSTQSQSTTSDREIQTTVPPVKQHTAINTSPVKLRDTGEQSDHRKGTVRTPTKYRGQQQEPDIIHVVRSPYDPTKLCKRCIGPFDEQRQGAPLWYNEAFDIDDPAHLDQYPVHNDFSRKTPPYWTKKRPLTPSPSSWPPLESPQQQQQRKPAKARRKLDQQS